MIYISSSCSKHNRIGSAVQELAKLGFRNIELTGGTVFYEALEQDLIRLREKYDLSYLIHNYFPPQREDFVLNIASQQPDIQKKIRELVKDAVRLLQLFGNNIYSMHPGFLKEMLPEFEDNFFVANEQTVTLREDFYKTLGALSNEIIPQNFKIAVENLGLKTANNKFSFLCDNGDIEEFLIHFKDNKKIGVLLDLAHLNVASQILGFNKEIALNRIVDNFKEKIFAIHLSENNGKKDSHDVLFADSWQVQYLKNHDEIFNNIPIVCEWHGSASKEIYENFRMIENTLGFYSAIMEDAQ